MGNNVFAEVSDTT
jgi:hypothetical protein